MGNSIPSKTPTMDEQEVILKLKKYIHLPNLEKNLCESKSLDVLIMGDMGDGNIVEGLIGMKLSEMSRTSESEIVVYRARREGIDVTLWNAPSLSFDQPNYTQEIKKMLEKVDLKFIYIAHRPDEDIFKCVTDVFGIEILFDSVIVAPGEHVLVEHLTMFIQDNRTFCWYLGDVSPMKSCSAISKIWFWDNGLSKPFCIDVVHSDICTLKPSPNPDWRSELFFNIIRSCSSDTKGALLKLNLRRFKHIPEGTEPPTPSEQCPVEEQPLTFTIVIPNSCPLIPLSPLSPLSPPIINCALRYNGPSFNLPVHPSELFPPPPPPQPEEDDTKSEGVDELTHFYTGTHDLLFGAHGGATPTSAGEHTTSNPGIIAKL